MHGFALGIVDKKLLRMCQVSHELIFSNLDSKLDFHVRENGGVLIRSLAIIKPHFGSSGEFTTYKILT